MSFLKKFGPILTTVGLYIGAAYSPAASAYVASHKVLATSLAVAVNALHAVLPSLFQSSNQPSS